MRPPTQEGAPKAKRIGVEERGQRNLQEVAKSKADAHIRAAKAKAEAERKAAEENARREAEAAAEAKAEAERKAAEETARAEAEETARREAEEAAEAKAAAKRKIAEEKARKVAEKIAQREAAKAAKAKAEAERCRDCEPLVELATPHVYRNNLFRVLGLCIDATPRDAQRQENRRKIQEKLGLSSTDASRGPFDLKPPPANDDVRQAMERLNRPQDRLLHEVFWFWPSDKNGSPDCAITSLVNGQVDHAITQWEQAAQNEGEDVAIHNLAVLDHMAALDYEVTLTSDAPYEMQEEQLDALWMRAFAHWKRVLAGERFWSALTTRVRAVDDVTLTTGVVRRIRSTLPMAILLINARIAYNAAERSEFALAERHIELLRKSGFADHFVEEALREALRPARNRIKAATDHARNGWTHAPHRGNQHVRELHAQVKPLLEIVDALLRPDDVTRAAIHDMIVEAMLEGQVKFGNKTNDWKECIELLTLARDVACGDATNSKLQENLDILQQNAERGNDWCTHGYWDLPQTTITQLEESRAKAQAGNPMGALDMLLRLDPAIGQPWRRCVAFCLDGHGWTIAREALDEFNSPTTKLQKFLLVIRLSGSVAAPNPNMLPAFGAYGEPFLLSRLLNPSCPCCGSTSYTQWVKGTYNGQEFWMCGTCSAEDDRQRSQRKQTLRKELRKALEYVILAAEIDRDDPDIGKGLETLKELLEKTLSENESLAWYLPRTRKLRKRLARTRFDKCERCRTKLSVPDFLSVGICRQCDSDLFRLSVPSRLGIATFILGALVTIFGFNSVIGGGILMGMGLAFGCILKGSQMYRRRTVLDKRFKTRSKRYQPARNGSVSIGGTLPTARH